jgi:hypothetical protein
MDLKPRLCLKCGVEIIDTTATLKPNFVQIYFEQDNGNYVAVAFCKSCNIGTADFEEITLSLKLESKIVGIKKVMTLKDIAMERQGSLCFICGQKIETDEVEVMTGGFVRHLSCPMNDIKSEVVSSPGRHSKEHNERHRRVQ